MSHYLWLRIVCVTLFLWIVTGDVVNVPCLAGTLNEMRTATARFCGQPTAALPGTRPKVA